MRFNCCIGVCGQAYTGGDLEIQVEHELSAAVKSERMMRLDQEGHGDKERRLTHDLEAATQELVSTRDALQRCQQGASLLSKEISGIKDGEKLKANELLITKQSLDEAILQRESIIQRLSAQLEESAAECDQLRECNMDLQSAIETDVQQLHSALCQAHTDIEELQDNLSDEGRRSAVSASQAEKLRNAQNELKRGLREAESLLLRTDEERYSDAGVLFCVCRCWMHKHGHTINRLYRDAMGVNDGFVLKERIEGAAAA